MEFLFYMRKIYEPMIKRIEFLVFSDFQGAKLPVF